MTTPPPPPAPPAPPAPPPPHQRPPHDRPPHDRTGPPRKLVRLTDQQRIAGVAAGIGWYLGIDPVLVRIGFVVLTIATGLGIPAYALAWILLPAATSTSPDAPIAPRRKDGRSLGLAVVAIVAALLLVGQINLFSGEVLAAALLIGAGVLLFTDANPLGRGGTPGAWHGWTPPQRTDEAGGTGSCGGSWDWGASWGNWGTGSWGTPPWGTAAGGAPKVDLRKDAAPPSPAGHRPESAYAPYAGAWRPHPTAPRARRRRPRSFLGGLAVAAWVAAMGVAVLLDRIGTVDLTPVVVVALTVTVAGIALLVGTFFGRDRGLIVIGLLGTLLLIPLTAVPDELSFSGGVGDRTETPQSVADVPDEYVMFAGSQTIDLTELDDLPSAGEVLPVAIDMNVGELLIRVPDDVDVDVDGTMSFGQYDVFGTTDDGPDLVIHESHDGGASADVATFAIDLEMFAGDVTVEAVGPR